MSLENQSVLEWNRSNNAVSPNSTVYLDYYQPKRGDWYWIALGFISVITTVGNSSVIFLVLSKRSFRNKVSPNWFIVSLGISDLLIGAFTIPVEFVCSFTTQCSYHTALVFFCLMTFFLTASTSNVCLLTFDIYLAVFHPFWYPNLMSPTKSRLFIFSSWLFAALLNIPFFISSLTIDNTNAFIADNIVMIIFYALTSLYLTYAFGRILLVVRGHKKDIEKHHLQLESNDNSRECLTNPASTTPSSRVRRRNRDGTITATGVVTATFLICNAVWEYWLFHLLFQTHIPMPQTLIDVTHLLNYCNCTMNFVVYALLRKDLRSELERYFRKIFKKGDGSETVTLSHLRRANRQTGTTTLPSSKNDNE